MKIVDECNTTKVVERGSPNLRLITFYDGVAKKPLFATVSNKNSIIVTLKLETGKKYRLEYTITDTAVPIGHVYLDCYLHNADKPIMHAIPSSLIQMPVIAKQVGVTLTLAECVYKKGTWITTNIEQLVGVLEKPIPAEVR